MYSSRCKLTIPSRSTGEPIASTPRTPSSYVYSPALFLGNSPPPSLGWRLNIGNSEGYSLLGHEDILSGCLASLLLLQYSRDGPECNPRRGSAWLSHKPCIFRIRTGSSSPRLSSDCSTFLGKAWVSCSVWNWSGSTGRGRRCQACTWRWKLWVAFLIGCLPVCVPESYQGSHLWSLPCVFLVVPSSLP